MRYPFGRLLAAWAITGVGGSLILSFNLWAFYDTDLTPDGFLSGITNYCLFVIFFVLLPTLPCFLLTYLISRKISFEDRSKKKVAVSMVAGTLWLITVIFVMIIGGWSDVEERLTVPREMLNLFLQLILPFFIPLFLCIWIFDFNDEQFNDFEIEGK